MTATTTNFAIPYPTGTDVPCSLDDTLSDAADAICAMLSTVGAALLHAVDRPIIKVTADAGQTLLLNVSSSYSTWKSVEIDTTGTVDLAIEAQGVRFPAGYDGVFLTGFKFESLGVNAGGPIVTIRTLDGQHSTGDETGSSGTIGAAVCIIDQDSPLSFDRLYVTTSGAATTISPTMVEMYMVSMSD